MLPWLGGRKVYDRDRSYVIDGDPPPEHGWYSLAVDGSRKATVLAPCEADFAFDEGRSTVSGLVVGDRLIPDGARVVVDAEQLWRQTERLWLLPDGLDRFARALAVRTHDKLVFLREEFPLGPEPEVRKAWEDGLDSVDHVAAVTPALDLAFRFARRERQLRQERAERLRRERVEREERARREAEAHARWVAQEALRREVQELLGTAAGRRQLAAVDFAEAARAALAVSGAELLDERRSAVAGESVVVYRHRGQRFECVVETRTLRIVDAGICLEDHDTGERGDQRFTLESLPGVIDQAEREGRLVVWRHG